MSVCESYSRKVSFEEVGIQYTVQKKISRIKDEAEWIICIDL
jgi:hypothetical protein